MSTRAGRSSVRWSSMRQRNSSWVARVWQNASRRLTEVPQPDLEYLSNQIRGQRLIGRKSQRALAGKVRCQLLAELLLHGISGREEAVVRLERVVRHQEAAMHAQRRH